MTESISNHANFFRLAVAGVTTAVAVSLVSAPIAEDVTVPRHPHAVQLSTIAVDLTAAAHTTAIPDRSAAAIPQLNFAPPTPQQVVATVGIIAIASAWYAAFPVTLPLSVGIGVLLNVLVKGVSMQQITFDPVFILEASAASFLAAPLFLASPFLALTATTKASSAAAQSNSTPAAQPSNASQSARQDRGKPAIAGTRRHADTHRTPSAHSAPKGPGGSTGKKRSATAGSARPQSKDHTHG